MGMTMAVFEAAIEPLLDHVQIELLSECLGAAELYEMYEELRPSARRLLADMERALDLSDLNEAKRSAHALKGVASSFGALRLSQLAKIVELHCRSLPEAKAQVNLLTETIERTVDALSEVTCAE